MQTRFWLPTDLLQKRLYLTSAELALPARVVLPYSVALPTPNLSEELHAENELRAKTAA